MLLKTFWLLLALLSFALAGSGESSSEDSMEYLEDSSEDSNENSSEDSSENSFEDSHGHSSEEPDLSHIEFHYYANSNYTYNLKNLYQILDNEEFRFDHMTHMYAPGYSVDQTVYHVQLLIHAYQTRKSVNFFIINWASLSNVPYTQAQKNIPPLARETAKAILKLFDYGLDRKLFRVVGFSLSSYLVSYTAKDVKKLSNNEVELSRITYLDPSNPAIHQPFILEPVGKTDAAFVDCIHTDFGHSGYPGLIGHVDFFPNGGKRLQPGCPDPQGDNPLCSHFKSMAYFAESVERRHTRKFDSYKADSYEDFLEGRHSDKTVPMGFWCPLTARGKYYLNLTTTYGEVPGEGIIL